MNDAVIRKASSRTGTVVVCAAWLMAAWAFTVAQTTSPQPGMAADDRRCLNCHGQPHVATLSEQDRRGMVSPVPADQMTPRGGPERLLVDPAARQFDVHRQVSCVACHADAERLPHAARLKSADCARCHAQAADAVIQSAHAAAALKPGMTAPTCGTCHGSHDIRRKDDPQSRSHPLRVIQTCGSCHQQHTGSDYSSSDGAGMVSGYMDSVHGRAISRAGLVVAASCADCHGHHDIRPHSDPLSKVAARNVPATCGRCHVGIEETFADSVHAEAARKKGSRLTPPVCSDCHSAHHISRADTPAFQRDIINECGTCHEALYKSYRASYHGQVQQLGSARAARCSSCHGTHDIRPPDDPKSLLSNANRANTCAACHTELKTASARTRANFIKFSAHASYRDRHNHPILFYIWLYFMVVMGITFTFWGIHSIAWYIRGGIEHRRQGKRRHEKHAWAYQRFSAWHRWTHGLVIVSFFGLTLTGLPLKFSDHRWSAALMTIIGGPENAGFAHRCFAVMVLIYLVMHGVHLWKNRRGEPSFLTRVFGPHSMLPTGRDWREFTQMVRWFLGRGPKPRFDRWTYWEKFDYWADLFGTIIIGGSGLLLWFPTFFAQFLSGYWFNIATVVHGYEALLAAGFIFTIHFFNAHLRHEKFPVDKVIFTGQITEEEFREERPAQYERLKAEGRLEELRVPAAPAWQHALAEVVALFALGIGFTLVVLIIYAGLS